MIAELVCQKNDVVGESILWDQSTSSLIWIDIVSKHIRRLHLESGQYESWEAPDFITSIGLRKDGGAVVGLSREVALWDFGGLFKTLALPEPDIPDNRLNEGVVGPDGAFWVGTMQNNLNLDGSSREMDRSSGAVYRITSDGTVSALTKPTIGLTNTLVWMPECRFVAGDTLANILTVYDYDDVANTITNPRPFAEPFDRGVPDGSCVDAEGYLWNCRVFGGACLVRYSPEGVVDRVVDLPCTWPTSCTFGGPDLDTLFITSAQFTMTVSLLGLLLYTTLNSLVISLIFRRVIFRKT